MRRLAASLGMKEEGRRREAAFKNGRTIRELARERGFSEEELNRIIDPAKLTEPGLEGGGGGGG